MATLGPFKFASIVFSTVNIFFRFNYTVGLATVDPLGARVQSCSGQVSELMLAPVTNRTTNQQIYWRGYTMQTESFDAIVMIAGQAGPVLAPRCGKATRQAHRGADYGFFICAFQVDMERVEARKDAIVMASRMGVEGSQPAASDGRPEVLRRHHAHHAHPPDGERVSAHAVAAAPALCLNR